MIAFDADVLTEILAGNREYAQRAAAIPTHEQGVPVVVVEEILRGPAHENDGTLNLLGGLRTSMATTGYETVKEFQKAEVMVAPSLQTEGKSLQRSQRVGMG